MRKAALQRPFCLLVIGFLASRCFACIPEDEFQCEDAAARLKSCCGTSAVKRCTYEHETHYVGGGCSGKPLKVVQVYKDPEIMGKDAVCLAGASCAAVRAAGACKVTTWLGEVQCNPESGWSNSGGGTSTCTSPGQGGPCEGTRPYSACQALRGLTCR